jgi:hypothetical protein
MEKKTFIVGSVLLVTMAVLFDGFMSTAYLLGSFVLCWAVYYGVRYTGLTRAKSINPKQIVHMALATSILILTGITFIFGTGINLIVYAVWLVFFYWHELSSLKLKKTALIE